MGRIAEDLIFSRTTAIEYASNTFIDVPIILQYDDTPLIEVVSVQNAGFTSAFSIYNQNGDHLAQAKGSQLYLTDVGKKCNLELRHLVGVTSCELDGKTLFEIRRKDPAALKAEAELYAPDGLFIKSNGAGFPSELVKADKSALRIGGLMMTGNTFKGFSIGVRLDSSGGISVGVR